MANLHSRISTDASVGTTIGTFDAIDTRNGNNILQHDAKVVAGGSFRGGAGGPTTPPPPPPPAPAPPAATAAPAFVNRSRPAPAGAVVWSAATPEK